MSHYSEGQTHQLVIALERAGFTSAEISRLGQHPALEEFRLVLNGKARIEPNHEVFAGADLTPYTEKQTHELMRALEEAKYTSAEITLLGQYHALGDFRLVINDVAKIVPIIEASAQEVFMQGQGLLNFDIFVDRSVRPIYPAGTKQPMNPALERKGPGKYHLSNVELWLHPGQNSLVRGQIIYDFLEKTDEIYAHLNLQDGLAIQKKGITVFRQFFKGKAVFLWKSVIMRHRGLVVPFLEEKGGEVVLLWRGLDREWNSVRPALRFAKAIL